MRLHRAFMTRRRAIAATALFLLLGTHDATLRQATSTTSNSVITEASIRGHMEFLASDAMKGRGSGTEDEWRAAVYIGSQMRRWGIEPLGDNGGFVKQIDSGRVIVSAPPTLSIGGASFMHGREMIVQSIGRGSVSGPLTLLT